jgi:hypothetical protein
VTTLKNTTAEERLGILFVTYVLCTTQQGKVALSKSEKMTVLRTKLFLQVFERLLIFTLWMSKTDGFWKLGDESAKKLAQKSIKSLMRLISENFERESAQGWNLSKFHEFLHITHYIDLYGAPTNFETGPCERMHKEIAKKPGRKSQKNHATFTKQAASRLAQRYIIDIAHNRLVPENETQKCSKSRLGSSFTLNIALSSQQRPPSYNVSVSSFSGVVGKDLCRDLYPDLAEFIVSFFAQFKKMPTSILCCSEALDETGNLYRAHHDYRGSGFWNDWAWVSYSRENVEGGFTNVPAKLLCFLPHGLPGNEDCHVVCHPCKWPERNNKVSSLVSKWKLVPPSEATYNKIPYDIVPVSSIFSHCLIVPDLEVAGVVYEILEQDKWSTKF